MTLGVLRFLIPLLLVAAPAAPQPISPTPKAPITAVRAAAPPRIDGRLDDAAWLDAPVFSDFRQRDPDEGAPVSERTELRVLYDADALYVGARLSDREPQGIVRRQSRRDVLPEADAFSIFLDPHHDRLTGVELRVSAAGSQRDLYIFNDTVEDPSWDAVWASAVTVDDEGWTVELRIPFSQLRFTASEQPVWGINAQRVIYRKNESAWASLVPRNQSGLASGMTTLVGLSALGPRRHMELRPYATSRAEFIEPASAGDPFNDGSRLFGGIGLDAKYGVSTNLTLDATVNPDFGQVEVDPAVVNLSAFETFFEEKRPFFMEGTQTFQNYGRSGANTVWNFFRPDPTIFYSRRIGRPPQGSTSEPFADAPSSTTIIGAAKLAGRTRSGWTLSLIDALTAREFARVSDGIFTTGRVEVEPLTNYAAGRAFKEIGRRAAVGFIGTATHRDFRSSELADVLSRQAVVGGVDGHWFLDSRRDWVVHGSLASSRVSGTPAAIERLQRAAPRYFQRPDEPHVHLDPTRESLAGWMGDVALNRNSGNVIVNARLWGTSPGFDSNDLGFVTQTDRGGAHGLIMFRKLSPDRLTRTRQLSITKWWTWNFARESQGDGVQATANLQFLNYWRFNATGNYSRATLDDKLTRGGPTVIRPGIRSWNMSVVSDSRQLVTGNVYATWQARDFGHWSRSFGGGVEFRPSTAFSISSGPAISDLRNVAQYLTTVSDPLAVDTFGARYAFGDLRQTEVSLPTRVNAVFSPTLSLQVYAQPLVSVGDFGDIREFLHPRTYDFGTYGRDLGTINRIGSSVRIDPDGSGPSAPFTIKDPDFNVKSLRLNAILRWEFRPGSTMYFVWTEQRFDNSRPGELSFGRDLGDALTAPPDDVVMVKVSWWIGR